MTLAAIVPIGDPRVNGYGNNLATCLDSFSRFADMVFLVQTHPAKSVLYPYIGGNIQLISNESTWLPGGIYDGKRMNRNIRIGEHAAQSEGADLFIVLSSNWYIPEYSREALRVWCDEVETWAWVYRGNQLAGQLFGVSKRLPMVWRDGSECWYSFSPDGLQTPHGFIPVERGDFRMFDNEMVVDAPFEIMPNDLEGKLNFVRCYSDDMPKRNPVFDWDYWHKYYLDRMEGWRPLDTELDDYGAQIAAASKSEYLSHLFLQEMALEPG